MDRGTEALSLVVAGHVSGGMSRSDLKDVGETLDAGEAALVVAAASDRASKVQATMSQTEKVESKPVQVDADEMENERIETVRVGGRTQRHIWLVGCPAASLDADDPGIGQLDHRWCARGLEDDLAPQQIRIEVAGRGDVLGDDEVGHQETLLGDGELRGCHRALLWVVDVFLPRHGS